jgi:hypothetical protein
MITSSCPRLCPICSRYLTTAKEYGSGRCVDPGHWIAAGELSSDNFYELARVAAVIRNQPKFLRSRALH